MSVILIFALLSLTIWLFLIFAWGNFWKADQYLKLDSNPLAHYPAVCAIVPARNEADVIAISLKSLLTQDYTGQFSIILVDDQSSDRTGEIAQNLAQSLNKMNQLIVIFGKPLASGWSGKLWAMEQGIQAAKEQALNPQYFLFTDADIQHHSSNLKELVIKTEQDNLALTSLMVLLRCESFWEKFLIPAFVFFFQKLYPFPWVNNPQCKMAAAAGGCILIRREALENIGGVASLKESLIDDCTLAQKVKAFSNSNQSTAIWLGLTQSTLSLRAYDSLDTIWNMIARTAYTQLYYNPGLLLGTLFGMTLVYLMAPIAFIVGLVTSNGPLLTVAIVTWILMAIAYLPTLKLYRLSHGWSLSLPLIAFLYNLMALDSAWRYWRGQGGAWKGRVYSQQ